MNKKLVSLVLSLILTSSLTLNVNASDLINKQVEHVPTVTDDIRTTTVLEKNKVNPQDINSSDIKTEVSDLNIPDEIRLFIGNDFIKDDLIHELALVEFPNMSIETNLKDGVLTKESAGQHSIAFDIKDSSGSDYHHSAKLIVTGKPEITLEQTSINRGEIFSLDLLSPSAFDHEDGDLSDHIQLNSSEVALGDQVDLQTGSSFKLTLSVSDSDLNEVTFDAIIHIHDSIATPLMMNPPSLNLTKTISGLNRFETSVAISKEMYDSTNTAVLVSSTDFPDALAAGPLSIAMEAPILLTKKDTLPKETLEELQRLKVTKVIIMGGSNSISKKIETALRNLTPKVTIERIYGIDRYQTALAAAKKFDNPGKIFLTNGLQFADAMTAGSYASKNGYPIVLTKNNVLSDETKVFLENSVAEIVIMGGYSAVSENIEKELISKNKTVTRIHGLDRYATALDMANKFFPASSIAVVANGHNFVDALTAVPYASNMSAPILLTKKAGVDVGVTEFLTTSSLAYFHFIGGESVISPNTKSNIMFPSMYDVSYRTGNMSGTWSSPAKNGQISGNLSSNGISLFDIKAEGNKDITIAYTASVIGSGWQNIVTSGQTGIKGKLMDGLLMELRGNDASALNLYYRVFQNAGWSSWTLGGKVAGVTNGSPILAVETRIIKGNSSAINKSLFPSKPMTRSYYTTKTTLNLREEPDSTSKLVTSMHNKADLELISFTSDKKWAKFTYVNLAGTTYTGYASMAYISTETLVSAAILTLNGLQNGQSLPNKTVQITGDAAYNKGIKEINYYVNGILKGQADYGHLTLGGIKYGFDSPQKTGYKFTIPSSAWESSKINTLKVEIVGVNGIKEWETVYLGGDSKNILLFEKQNRSFNYFARKEDSQNKANFEQVSTYMDPSKWITDPNRRFMFLDVTYSPSDFTVTAEQINKMLVGKGVLDGMASTILQASIDFKVNPLYLVAHSILETGHGKSKLAGGQSITHYHTTFGNEDSTLIPLSPEDVDKKWYNMFGIGAWDRNANLWGVEKAYLEGWESVEKSLYGSAKWINTNYIYRTPYAQNTTYKMRYNINEGMSHEYASDTGWAYKQAAITKQFYNDTGINPVNKFIVPIFDSMRP